MIRPIANCVLSTCYSVLPVLSSRRPTPELTQRSIRTNTPSGLSLIDVSQKPIAFDKNTAHATGVSERLRLFTAPAPKGGRRRP